MHCVGFLGGIILRTGGRDGLGTIFTGIGLGRTGRRDGKYLLRTMRSLAYCSVSQMSPLSDLCCSEDVSL